MDALTNKFDTLFIFCINTKSVIYFIQSPSYVTSSPDLIMKKQIIKIKKVSTTTLSMIAFTLKNIPLSTKIPLFPTKSSFLSFQEARLSFFAI